MKSPSILAALLTLTFMARFLSAQQQELDLGPEFPLEHFSFFIGQWGFTDEPSDEGFHMTLEWGLQKKAVRVSTPMGGGLILWHPHEEKAISLVHQVRSNLLMDGEYKSLGEGRLERQYTVFAKDPRNNNNTFREVWERINADSFQWSTHRLVDGKWEPFGPNGGTAVAHRWK